MDLHDVLRACQGLPVNDPRSVLMAGKMAASYRFVEYLKSNGTQYIHTDIVPAYTNKTVLDVKFNITSPDKPKNAFFGIQTGSSWYMPCLEQSWNDSDKKNCAFYIGFKWYSGIGISHIIQDVLDSGQITDRSSVILERPVCSYGQRSTTLNEPVTMDPPTAGVSFFGYTVANGVNCFELGDMYLYGAKIYDNDTLIHELIPAERRGSGILGLFDAVTGKFYPAVGTLEKGRYIE